MTGCGTTEKNSASNPQSSAAPHVVEAHYFIGYGDAGVYDPKAAKADVLTDGVRYRVLVVANGTKNGDLRELFVFDGHRLFVDDNDSAPQYVLYEAPQEHPDAVMFGSGFIFLPKMAPWNKMCSHDPPVPTSTGTVLGRDAQRYRCPGDPKFPIVWVDEDTGLLLQFGPSKALNLTVDPPITPRPSRPHLRPGSMSTSCRRTSLSVRTP